MEQGLLSNVRIDFGGVKPRSLFITSICPPGIYCIFVV